MDSATLSAKGQIVIPRRIQEKYNLKRGDCLLVKDENGRIVLEVAGSHPILGLRGIFREKKGLTRALLEERKAERMREDGTHE